MENMKIAALLAAAATAAATATVASFWLLRKRKRPVSPLSPDLEVSLLHGPSPVEGEPKQEQMEKEMETVTLEGEMEMEMETVTLEGEPNQMEMKMEILKEAAAGHELTYSHLILEAETEIHENEDQLEAKLKQLHRGKSDAELEAAGPADLIEFQDQVRDLKEKLSIAQLEVTQHAELTEEAVSGWERAAAEARSLKEKLSIAQLEITQHAGLTEEAVSGWERAAAEALSLKVHLEVVTLEKITAENRASHLDGALKECTKQMEFLKNEIRIEQQGQRNTARGLQVEEEMKMALIMSNNQLFVSRKKSEKKLQSIEVTLNQQNSPSKNMELRNLELMDDFLEVERHLERMEDFLKMERHLQLMIDFLERKRLATESNALKKQTPMKCNIPKVPRPLTSSKRPK